MNITQTKSTQNRISELGEVFDITENMYNEGTLGRDGADHIQAKLTRAMDALKELDDATHCQTIIECQKKTSNFCCTLVPYDVDIEDEMNEIVDIARDLVQVKGANERERSIIASKALDIFIAEA